MIMLYMSSSSLLLLSLLSLSSAFVVSIGYAAAGDDRNDAGDGNDADHDSS